MSHSRASVVLLGFTVDENVFAEIAQNSAVMPTQTHRFAWNLVGALKSAGIAVSLLSALPVPNYPEYPRIVIRANVFEQNGVQGIELGFLNVLILKHAARFLSCLTAGIGFVRKQAADTVVVHGVHTPFLVFARLLKLLLKVRIILVMTDPPGVVRPMDGAVTKILKRLDRRLLTGLASGFDGVICLTPALAQDFSPMVPSLILEGFANPELARLHRKSSGPREEFRIAYAGGINAEYGVENLVLAFQSISDPDARLRLYGKGVLDDWVMNQCRIDGRISHCGLLAHKDLMPELKQASILVNPRPAGQAFVRYSFPSKVLEYLALGVPMVTTKLEGLPKDYYPYVQIADDDSVASLARAIESVRSQYSAAAEKAARGQKHVLREKSVAAQGTKIADFLARLEGNTSDSIVVDDPPVLYP